MRVHPETSWARFGNRWLAVGASCALLAAGCQSTSQSTSAPGARTSTALPPTTPGAWPEEVARVAGELRTPVIVDTSVAPGRWSKPAGPVNPDEAFALLGLAHSSHPTQRFRLYAPRIDWDMELRSLQAKAVDAPPPPSETELAALGRSLKATPSKLKPPDRALLARVGRHNLWHRVRERLRVLAPEMLEKFETRVNWPKAARVPAVFEVRAPTGLFSRWFLRGIDQRGPGLLPAARPRTFVHRPMGEVVAQIARASHGTVRWREAPPAALRVTAVLPAAEEADSLRMLGVAFGYKLEPAGRGWSAQRRKIRTEQKLTTLARLQAHNLALAAVGAALSHTPPGLLDRWRAGRSVALAELPEKARRGIADAIAAKLITHSLIDAYLSRQSIGDGEVVIPRKGLSGPFLRYQGHSISLDGLAPYVGSRSVPPRARPH